MIDSWSFETSGSGVIISLMVYLITNEHVVKNASKIIVTLPGGDEYKAEIVGEDQITDLASVSLMVKTFRVKIGNSD